MSFNFRLPNITANTPEGKLQQMQSFLYQTIEQLNWAMNAIDGSTASGYVVMGNGQPLESATEKKEDNTVKFNDLKALIIKSADIVEAYYETISQKLSGVYVAQSEFGTYKQVTDAVITETSEGRKANYENIQQILTDVDNLEHYRIDTEAFINTGLLGYDDDGAPIYGMEIGQRNEIDGEEVFNKYARFTSEKLSFHDKNGNEVAYISDKKLYINHVEVRGTYKHGGFVDSLITGGIVTKWQGGGS